MIEELQWWTDELQAWNGKSIIPARHPYILTTDTSHHSWGGWWRRVGLQGHRNDEARGFFSRRESKMSSNSRKLTTLFSTMAAARHLTNRVVLVETDNITTKAYINHMGRRSRYLSAIAHRL